MTSTTRSRRVPSLGPVKNPNNKHQLERATAERVAAVALWLAVWQAASVAVRQQLILPGPVDVAVALAGLVGTPSFWAKVGFSALRIMGATLAAYVAAVSLALASARWRLVRVMARPPLVAVKSTPVVCVVVLLLMWLGSANVSVAAVFLMALPALYFPVLEGLDHVSVARCELFGVHGVRGAARSLGLVWPEVLPFLCAASETVVGMAWKAGVAAELIGVPAGSIGERIYQAKLLLETPDLFAWTMAVIALAAVCERAFLRVLRASGPAAVRLAVIARVHPAGERANLPRGAWYVCGLGLSHGTASPVSMTVRPGGRLCVMAPSGSGKTTLLRTLAGLDRSLGGSVVGPSRVSMEFQDARLVERASALQNVALTADEGVGPDEMRRLLVRLVPGVDADAAVNTLSGGQRRRVELARALMAPGDSVLLDEPFAGLDAPSRDLACDVITSELRGRSLVVATHDASDAECLGADTLELV